MIATTNTDTGLMIFPSPAVVAVDDDAEELEYVRKGLEAAQIACWPILYEDDFDKSFEDPYPGVRILFLDLHLLSGEESGTPQSKAGILATVIKKLVSSGPWTLIFWTSFPGEVDDVMKVLGEKDRFTDLPLPMGYDVIDKDEVRNAAFTSSPQDVEKLRRKIISILKGHPVSAALQWESRIARAAAESLGVVYELSAGVSSGEAPPDKKKTFISVLAGIAREALGKEASQKPHLAVERGLFPLLLDRIANMPTPSAYESIWNKLLNDSRGQMRKFPSGLDYATLNRHFLIHIQDELEKDQRGVWVECAKDMNDNDFVTLFGLCKTQLLDEFITLKGHNLPRNEKEKIRNACKIGFLEASAECDHAWKKLKILRYVLCVLIPDELTQYTSFKTWCPKANANECPGNKHDGIYSLPDMKINDKLYHLKINFRFAVGLPPESHYLGKPLFRLRRDVATDISFKCSQYWTRTGILSFREQS